jgi:lysophospholipase L1-like esterase
VGAVALVAVLVLGLGWELLAGDWSTPSLGPVAQASSTATPAASSTATVTPSDSPSPSPSPVPTPTAVPTAAPRASLGLPTMLAAIGDSYTQAWSVSPAYKRDHPGFSWAVGTTKRDGVFSLRERFEALGDKIMVVDAATSGKKMSDAARQATAIVAAAKQLPASSTVYVTFELGTNDLCDNPTTDPASFEAQLRSAIAILQSGLPSGSRILMLSIPDFAHFYDITQADAKAKEMLNLTSHSQTCAPFLGWDSPLSLQAAEQVLSTYDATLYQVCDEIEATDGRSGKLHCLRNDALLSEKDFTIKDLSTVDYFHPSLSGQARMAAAAWKAGHWANVPLPPGAAALAPGGAGDPGGAGGTALAGFLGAAPFGAWRRLRGPLPRARRRRRFARPRLGSTPLRRRSRAPFGRLAAPSRPA